MNGRHVLWAMGLLWACTGTAYASGDLVCETQTATWKRVVYQCQMTPQNSAQPLRFKADFSGSHDDTELSIALTLDGSLVRCAEGSKTWLNGEDGDVSLDCLFVVEGTADHPKTLQVAVNFYHARFMSVKLSPP